MSISSGEGSGRRRSTERDGRPPPAPSAAPRVTARGTKRGVDTRPAERRAGGVHYGVQYAAAPADIPKRIFKVSRFGRPPRPFYESARAHASRRAPRRADRAYPDQLHTAVLDDVWSVMPVHSRRHVTADDCTTL
ncbi:hypothetical protein EVAR_43567_1 [Eumeta japonica]|uniref:Uncharacterized protein n=1 Tax=Eumeta variegata TaxID=151549 RepID=A0A4C1XEX4_EUMVA|nr:hypothetical protein EVAR_43567_1 [Eumeta japonica]